MKSAILAMSLLALVGCEKLAPVPQLRIVYPTPRPPVPEPPKKFTICFTTLWPNITCTGTLSESDAKNVVAYLRKQNGSVRYIWYQEGPTSLASYYNSNYSYLSGSNDVITCNANGTACTTGAGTNPQVWIGKDGTK